MTNFFNFTIWADSTKPLPAVAGPISRVIAVDRDEPISDSYQFTVTVGLDDPIANSITQGQYCELAVGLTLPQTIWVSGYIRQITRSEDGGDAYTLTVSDPSYFLHYHRAVGALAMKFGAGYQWLWDAFNGTNAPGNGALPGQKGMWSGSNWTWKWLDGLNPGIGGTTTNGTITTGNTFIGTTGNPVSLGWQQYDLIQIGGVTGDYYMITNVGTTGVNIDPVAQPSTAAMTSGTAVRCLTQSQAPGVGHDWRTDWVSGMTNLITMAGLYNFEWRPADGNAANGGIIYAGPLCDDSGLSYWGGQDLLTDLNSSHSLSLDHPNAALAQKFGYATIESATFQQDLEHIINLVYVEGKSHGKHGFTGLHPLVGGQPLGGGGAIINGWSSWQPTGSGGRMYYTKAASKTTYEGQTYSFVATQQQDSNWAYGIVDMTSVSNYGVHEGNLAKRQIDSPDLLLAAGLGYVAQNANPIGTWTFKIRQPLTSASGVPAVPKPGQLVHIHYTGQVAKGLTTDTSTSSATFGQLISSGTSETYMTFPNAPAGASAADITKLSRVAHVQDTWDETGYSLTLTTGQPKPKKDYLFEHLAHEMEHNTLHAPLHVSFVKKQFEHSPWIFSHNPTAYDDIQNNQIVMAPGSFACSDTKDQDFFSDHHRVAFTFNFSDATQVLDFFFHKTIDSQLTSAASSAPYALYRIAGTSSGKQCGFYTTSDGVNFTRRGIWVSNGAMIDHLNVLGTYRLFVEWTGRTYSAHIHAPNNNSGATVMKEHPVARWNDQQNTVQQFGAIGFRLTGGSGTVTIKHLTAHPVTGTRPAVMGVNRGDLNPHNPGTKTRTKTTDPHGNGLGMVGKIFPI